MMRELGVGEFYHKRWSELGPEIHNTIGCSDCHDARTMDLKPARPALYEAWARAGKDVRKASHQEMRSLVCAQCHTEYYFNKETDYLMFPQDKGLTCEAAEEYYDSIGFYDYIHPLSKTPILKAQHPGYEIALQGIHGQRGVSCADCHMPYKQEGGVKFTDHHIMSPLANIDRTCQTCHRQSADVLRQNVYERQAKCTEVRDRAEKELATAHIEAKFAWEKGASEAEMKPIQALLRKSQWRWDYAIASHGATFHAPQEVTRLLSHSVDFAQQARLLIAKVAAKHGHIGDIPVPDYSTKAKAQAAIGLDMPKLKEKKKKFLDTVVPKWIEEAKKNGKLIEI
jgi:nitrite reductase (cytochrome c-552)